MVNDGQWMIQSHQVAIHGLVPSCCQQNEQNAVEPTVQAGRMTRGGAYIALSQPP